MTKTMTVPDDHTLHEPEAIYLEPKCQGEKWGRTWAEENAWGECDCGLSHPTVKYIRADLATPKPTIPEDDREEVADFDQACDDFAHWLKVGADWKNSYYGASYKTRLRHAIQDIRIACDQMEAAIAKDFPTPSEGGGK